MSEWRCFCARVIDLSRTSSVVCGAGLCSLTWHFRRSTHCDHINHFHALSVRPRLQRVSLRPNILNVFCTFALLCPRSHRALNAAAGAAPFVPKCVPKHARCAKAWPGDGSSMCDAQQHTLCKEGFLLAQPEVMGAFRPALPNPRIVDADATPLLRARLPLPKVERSRHGGAVRPLPPRRRAGQRAARLQTRAGHVRGAFRPWRAAPSVSSGRCRSRPTCARCPGL